MSDPSGPVWPLDCIRSWTRIGVRATPLIFESAALKMAAEVFPLATLVSTTDVETVEGKTQRYKKPSRRPGGWPGQST